METMPKERIVYFGDTARTPYGSKAESTIKHFSMQIADFLVKKNVKMIAIACNTVSATCLGDLKERFKDIPIVGVIEPAAQAISLTSSIRDRIGIIGTKATISSHAYRNIIASFDDRLKVYEKACPAFVPLIEEDIINSDIMDLTIKYYLDDFILENRIDTIVLGCTHYPLIRSNILRLYPELRIINPSKEMAGKIEDILQEKNMTAQKPENPNIFYASDLSENFINMIDKIFEDVPTKVKFKNLDIDAV